MKTRAMPARPVTSLLINIQYKGNIMKTYQCIVCGFIYDESIGMPEDGIPAGTRWDDIPADWECPDCGVAKADFEMVEI
jgi:rubredoxin